MELGMSGLLVFDAKMLEKQQVFFLVLATNFHIHTRLMLEFMWPYNNLICVPFLQEMELYLSSNKESGRRNQSIFVEHRMQKDPIELCIRR
jgi:hypothetical protein